jgi:hypothetical protein
VEAQVQMVHQELQEQVELMVQAELQVHQEQVELQVQVVQAEHQVHLEHLAHQGLLVLQEQADSTEIYIEQHLRRH